MAVTVDIRDECSAGHGKFTLTAGSNTWVINFLKSEVEAPLTPEEWEQAARVVMKFLRAASGVNTWAQLKTEYTNRTISL